jgi:hypothetical protein
MIRRHPALASLSFALLLLLATSAGAQTELTGNTSGGAFYKIMVPDGWEPADGLVIWNHGFSLDPIGPVTDLGPLAAVQLGEGYAVAASSYSLTGWALFETVSDNKEMVEAFESNFGVPEEIFLFGASLGGIVTAQAIEVGDLGNVVGALPICGAVAGSRVWDGGFDLRQIYDSVCDEVPGGSILEVPGLPYLPPPGFDAEAMALAIEVCTGLSQAPEDRTAQQAAALDTILSVTQLPENFLLTDMGFAVFGLADLIYDPRKLNGLIPFDNLTVDYGDVTVDATIGRVEANPVARGMLCDNYTPTGMVGDTKIVSLHTDKDGLVIVENESSYADVVPAKNLTVGIVVEDVPSHCDFTPAEVLSGWESLRAWVAGAPQPTAQDLQNTCLGIVGGGLAPGPCRIDPGFMIPPIGDRVRPRNICEADNETLCLGEGDRFRVRVEWMDFEGDQGDGKVLDTYGEESGAFSFFQADRAELMVKIVDGRLENGNFWFFYGSLSNVFFNITVTDMVTGKEKIYVNNLQEFASAGDTRAF